MPGWLRADLQQSCALVSLKGLNSSILPAIYFRKVLYSAERNSEEVEESDAKVAAILPPLDAQQEGHGWFLGQVSWLQLEDVLEPGLVLQKQVVVRMFLFDVLRQCKLGRCDEQALIMNNFQEDEFNVWRTRLQLAQQGNAQAIDEVRSQLAPQIEANHAFATANYAQLLKEASLRLLEKGQAHGSYEVHSTVPRFFLLQGKAGIQCINTEGDNDLVCSTIGSGLLELSETELRIKYGESNLALLTQFEVTALEKSVILEFSGRAVQAVASRQAEATLREEAIMRKYMLIALKHITKLTYSKDKPVLSKFYLLQGRACFVSKKGKYMLSCYQEGFFSPKHLNDDHTALYLFEGAYIMLLEEEMLKDEVVAGLEAKREEHIRDIQARYEKMSGEERQKVQEQMIEKYGLNHSEVERDIFGIEKAVEKFMRSKNDFIRTSSSMKDKCGIRIRKAKKTN